MERLTWRRPGDNAVCPRVPKDSDKKWIAGEFTQEVYNRLAAYEDAEEQGLLVRLPCKVGDMVYRIAHDEDGNPYFVKDLCVGFSIGLSGDLLMVASGDRRWSVERFGKSIFCTREEAEAALKGE